MNPQTNEVTADPGGAEEDAEDLLLGDWLVGGLRVGLGCRREDGVDVDIDQRDELRVDRGRRLAKLVEDPVLEEAERPSATPPAGPMATARHYRGHKRQRAASPTLMDTLCLVKARLRSSW